MLSIKSLLLASTVMLSEGLFAKSLSFPVPLLVGMDVKDPRIYTQHLKPAAFLLAVKKREKSSRISKDKIISQEPMAGAIVKAGSTIKVVISDGK